MACETNVFKGACFLLRVLKRCNSVSGWQGDQQACCSSDKANSTDDVIQTLTNSFIVEISIMDQVFAVLRSRICFRARLIRWLKNSLSWTTSCLSSCLFDLVVKAVDDQTH